MLDIQVSFVSDTRAQLRHLALLETFLVGLGITHMYQN
jgi:hypothetical protein